MASSPSGTDAPAADRRRDRRFRVRDCTLTFRRKRVLFFHERDEHRGVVRNMSSRGMAFVTREPVKPGEKLTVRFHVPPRVHAATAEVKLDCEVRWCKPVAEREATEANGQFLGMSAGTRAELKSLLEDLLVTGEILLAEEDEA